LDGGYAECVRQCWCTNQLQRDLDAGGDDCAHLLGNLGIPAYAIDEQTLKVVDGAVEVVSEGHWKLFTP
jgi:hypothetical protein